MNKAHSCIAEIKNIVREWFRHIRDIFVVIIFALLIFAASVVLQTDTSKETSAIKSLGNLSYEAVMTLTKTIFVNSSQLIAFPLIATFLFLICYTVYIISRIIRKTSSSGFNKHIFDLLCLLILSNCIFSYLIGQVGNHCLQAPIPDKFIKEGLLDSILVNFLAQLIVIMPILFIKDVVRFIKKEEILNCFSVLWSKIKRFLCIEIWLIAAGVFFIIWYNRTYVWIGGPLGGGRISHHFLGIAVYLILVILCFAFTRFIIRPSK